MTDTNHPVRRLRHGQRPTEPLEFEGALHPDYVRAVSEESPIAAHVVESMEAAANKAAEEGGRGLPPLPEMNLIVTEKPGLRFESRGYTNKQMHDYARQAIASDRASRQVANKAEVEPVAHLKFWANQSWSGSGNHDIEHGEGLEVCNAGEIGDDGKPAFPVYATPPATTGGALATPTGASTALTPGEREYYQSWLIADPSGAVERLRTSAQALLDAASKHEAHGDDGELSRATSAVDEALAASVGFVTAPASTAFMPTVLTDERELRKQLGRALGLVDGVNFAASYLIGLVEHQTAFCDEIEKEREVAAQAGQVAVPEDTRKAICQAVVNCGHAIESASVTLYADPKQDGNALAQLLDRIMAAAPAAPAQAKPLPADWISVGERLPDSGYCLATYRNRHGKLRIIRAKYARQFEIDAGEDAIDQGNCEYNEADDTFYLKAGWLECIDNWDDYSSIYVTEGAVTHWTPLPPLPDAQASTAGGRQEGGA